jgi:alanine racemase
MQSTESFAALSPVLPRRSWVEVHGQALRHNASLALDLVRPAGLLPIIKANAYGHGAVRTARALADLAGIFGVANLREALDLRENGVTEPLVLLSPCLPEERAHVVKHGLWPTVSSAGEALAYARLATPEKPVPLHFKIDTGMGRLGAWKEEGLADVRRLSREPALRIRLISTHLSAADEDPGFTREQLEWFAAAAPALREACPGVRLHALNSAGILEYPEFAFDLVRPGLMLYGAAPVGRWGDRLQPAMSWFTRVVLLRELPAGRRVSYGGDYVTSRPTRLAVLGVGYADGYFRQIPSGTARVLIRGQSCPVVGRITMDQILADTTHLPDIEVGDLVTLLGRDGDEQITAGELARWAGTIPWHVLTAIGPRVHAA